MGICGCKKVENVMAMIRIFPAWSKPLVYGLILLGMSYGYGNLTVFSALSALSLMAMSLFRRVRLHREKRDYFLSKNRPKDRWLKCLTLLFASVLQILSYLFGPESPNNWIGLLSGILTFAAFPPAVIGTLYLNYQDRTQ